MPWALTHGGPEVDFCAPGYEIYIPFPYRKRGKEYYAYKWSEGSSFSVPITACAAALWLLHHGIDNLKKSYPGQQLSDLFRNTCKKTVTPFSGPTDNSIYGTGILNVKNLLATPLSKPKLSPDRKISVQEARIAVDNIKKIIDSEKNSYLKEKELVYHTLMAKLETEDSGNDLSEYVLEKLSTSGKNHIGKNHDSESIKKQVNTFTKTYY